MLEKAFQILKTPFIILQILSTGLGQSHKSYTRAAEAHDDEVYSVGEPERRGQNGTRKMGVGVGLVHN